LLEEYLQHRKHLLQDTDSEFLFPSEAGTMITRAGMTIIVGEPTLRHIGKRVTPHTFRHIVAYAWLDDHPEDYLTLSKILFHTKINTTLKCHGARFNESNGARGMEKWVKRPLQS
jgi:site-specific recombinase XerD